MAAKSIRAVNRAANIAKHGINAGKARKRNSPAAQTIDPLPSLLGDWCCGERGCAYSISNDDGQIAFSEGSKKSSLRRYGSTLQGDVYDNNEFCGTIKLAPAALGSSEVGSVSWFRKTGTEHWLMPNFGVQRLVSGRSEVDTGS